MSSATPCQVCGAKIGKMSGVFCANFGTRRSDHLKSCFGAWHSKCYCQNEKDKFPVLTLKDLDEGMVSAEDLDDNGEKRFCEARDGDFLLTPFQCDLCHYQNMTQTNPEPTKEVRDEALLLAIWRANLDAFWSRERGTVEANRREGV